MRKEKKACKLSTLIDVETASFAINKNLPDAHKFASRVHNILTFLYPVGNRARRNVSRAT